MPADEPEPLYRVANLPFDEACNIGQRFRQDAIYHVKNDVLSVARCKEQRALVVGSFRERLDPENQSG
jgi:hypothetical protein